jgi:hypothetical protein
MFSNCRTAAIGAAALGLFAALAPPMQAVGAPLAATTTTISIDTSTVSVGDSFTLTATVTAIIGGAGSPTGLVQIFEAGMPLGSPVTLVPTGGIATASLAEIANAAGDFPLAPTYSGDANFEPSSASVLLVVLPNAVPAPEPASLALLGAALVNAG